MPTASADSRSANSLSTTASTSSHTLKTPHSKVDYSRSPVIASGSGSSDDHASPVAAMAVRRAKEIAEPRSPTPTQPRLSSEGQNPSERVLRERLPPPPLTHTPLPLTPVGFAATSMHEENTARRLSDAPRRSRQHPPAPLDMRNENRLSKDWIPVHVSGPSSPDQMRPKSTSPHPEPVLSQHHRAKWPAATMVPVKESPKRPSFERAQIAPPIAITERKQTEGRVSLDHMRNTSPTRTTSRQNSRSTPPAAMLDMAIASTGNRLHVFHDGTTRNVSPLRTRSSEDVLRPSMDSTRAGMTKKHIKAKQKEQQQGLGVASTVVNSSSGAEPDRKSSGLSLKKSSGALRNLFSRGVSGKGKDRMETPPMPLAEDRAKVRGRPSTAPTSDDSRPHPSFGQPRTPGSVLPTRVASVGQESPSVGPGRSSLSIERTVYPAPPLSRAASQGSQPVMSLPVRARSPQRDLPPLPAPSPVPPFEHRSTQSTLAEALPASSLPYLSPMRASFLLETNDPNRLSTSADRFSSVSSSASTARPTENASEEISPIKPSRSLHLLQLPDFDLDLADAFDKIGMSPATPRKLSPRRSPQAKASPKSPTPQRSLTTRLSPTASPPTISRTGSERRRSQSFDGPPSHADLWRVDAVKLFASATSTSAPMLSNSNAPAATEEVPPPVPLLMTVPQHIHNHSVSSQPSAPSSSDHARTPSNASSTNETSSPSPPHTPREEKSPVGLSIGDFESPSRLPTPTASAPDGPEQSLAARKPFVFSKPPSIPLPAAPVPVWSPALAPSAVIELVEPVEPEQNVIKGPRKNKRVLLSRSKLVTAETTVSSKTLGRELELLLYS